MAISVKQHGNPYTYTVTITIGRLTLLFSIHADENDIFRKQSSVLKVLMRSNGGYIAMPPSIINNVE